VRHTLRGGFESSVWSGRPCRSIHALHPLRPRCPVDGVSSARAASITPRVCWKGIGFSACRSIRPHFVRLGASILPILKMEWTRSTTGLELRMGRVYLWHGTEGRDRAPQRAYVPYPENPRDPNGCGGSWRIQVFRYEWNWGEP